MVNLDPDALYANNLSPHRTSQRARRRPTSSSRRARRRSATASTASQLNSSPTDGRATSTGCRCEVVDGTPVLLGDVAPVTNTHQVADQRRARRRRPRHLSHDHQARRRVDARRRRPREGGASRHPGDGAEGARRRAHLRPVDVRARRARGTSCARRSTAAVLVALMVLVFLGSARSMLIVIISIPLSILTAIVGAQALRADDQHHDARRARARGRHAGRRRHGRGREHPPQPRDGQAAADARSSTAPRRSRCRPSSARSRSASSSFPVVLLSGVAKFLFTPLALAVVFAMLTSYLLSRTLVPTMARYLLPEAHEEPTRRRSLWRRFLARLRSALRAPARALPRARSGRSSRTARFALAVRRARHRRVVRPRCSVVGEDFFPTRRRRHDEAARPCPDRHPHRADRAHRRRRRARRSATIVPGRRARPASATTSARRSRTISPSTRPTASARRTPTSSSSSSRSIGRPPSYQDAHPRARSRHAISRHARSTSRRPTSSARC